LVNLLRCICIIRGATDNKDFSSWLSVLIASGEQDEEKGFWGNEITGTAEAVIDEYGEVTYQNVTADIVGIDTGEDYDDTDEEDITKDEDNDEENKDFINDNDTVDEGEPF
jgi:hypothetical protein